MSKETPILVTRSSMPQMEEYIEEIKSIWESHWLTNMGEKHQKLQQMLREYLDVSGIELLTNGHMAIELTLQAMELEGEVITTPFTFASTTHAIVRNGLTPVFCDIDPTTFTMDVTKIEALITDRTCAILPVHVYGNICDVDAIERIAKKYDLKVIYDAAHAFGESYHGRNAATFGDASCFSFHATKVYNTIEGGAVAFHDEALGAKLYDLKNFGIHGPEEVESVGANAKMNEFCAAMGICNLRHLDEEIAKRKAVYDRYMERLSNISGITLNPVAEGVEPNYAYFPILIDPEVFGCDRDDLAQKLRNEGIFARKYFYPITTAFDCYKDWYKAEDTPIALAVSRQVLTIPMYADLDPADVDRICDVIVRTRG